MNKWFGFLLVLLFLPTTSFAEGINAGFVQGLWYSHEPIFADEPVRVYAALRNNTEGDLTARVRFLDNGKTIGVAEVSALSGRLVESWSDWTPTYGEHTLTAELSNIRIHAIGGETTYATTTHAVAESVVFVDHDTDNDGIGNESDTDDDNDGVSDEEEKERGTDPLVYNDPEDSERDDRESRRTRDQEEDENNTSNDDESAGFETYLGDGPIKNTFAFITDGVHELKDRVDTYREERSAQDVELADEVVVTGDLEPATGTPTGVGEITRTEETPRGPSFLARAQNLIAALADALFTSLLYLLSIFLIHPAVVQVSLLILIFALLYLTARRFGRRPIDR